jgi:hypothetical protein
MPTLTTETQRTQRTHRESQTRRTNAATSGLGVYVNAANSAPIAIAPNICRARIAIPQTIAPKDVAYARPTWSATVNAAGAGVMAVHKLAALLVVLSGVIPITAGRVSPDTGRTIAVVAVRPIAITIAMTFPISPALGQGRR